MECLPAVVWADGAPRALRCVGDDLVWLTEPRNERAHSLWRVATRDLGVAAPHELATFPVEIDESVRPDGVVERHAQAFWPWAIAVDAHRLYVDYPGGVAAIPLGGGALALWTTIPGAPTTSSRRLTSLVFVGGFLYAAGYDLNYAPRLKHWTYSAFVARVVANRACVVWERPIQSSPDIEVAARDGCALFAADGLVYRIHAGACVELVPVTEISRVFAVRSGFLALTMHSDLVWIDPKSGALGSPLLSGLLDEITAVAQVGNTLCIAVQGVEYSRIIAVTRDGRCRDILCTAGSIGSLCADRRFLYWADHRSECICRVPLGIDGAPAQVVAEELPAASGQRAAASGQRAAPVTLVPSPTVDDPSSLRVVCDALLGVAERWPAPPPDAIVPDPWIGWLMFALLEHCAALATSGGLEHSADDACAVIGPRRTSAVASRTRSQPAVTAPPSAAGCGGGCHAKS